MDALFAFDNAVEKFLEISPAEPLPEQLAKLRFLFEEEFDKLWVDDLLNVEKVERIHRDRGSSGS